MKNKVILSLLGIIIQSACAINNMSITPAIINNLQLPSITEIPIITSTISIIPSSIPTPIPIITNTPAWISIGGGGKIVYSYLTSNGQFTDTYLFDVVLGKEVPLIIGDLSYKRDYSWSPDSKQIAFMSDFEIPDNKLMIVDVESGKTNTLVYSKTYRNFYPSWSPNGQSIAFTSDRDGPQGEFHLFVINVDGTNTHRLTNFHSYTPDWSSDGKSIVFAGEMKNGDIGIYVINNNGTNLKQLVDFGESPKWSPDGKKIVFLNSQPFSNHPVGLYVMNADGNGIVFIHQFSYEPSWSKDGNLIIFGNYDENGESHIYIMDPDGNNLRILPTRPNIFHPKWSR